jgi:hypothetical protein
LSKILIHIECLGGFQQAARELHGGLREGSEQNGLMTGQKEKQWNKT